MYLSMEMESFHFTVALSMSGEEYIHEQYRHVSGPKSYSVVLAVEWQFDAIVPEPWAQ